MAPEDIDAISPGESETQKAELDTEEIASAAVPKEAQKVELDLDDAPFLEEEEEEEEEQQAAPESMDLDEDEDEQPWFKRKKIIIAAAAAIAALAVAAVLLFVVLPGGEDPAEEKAEAPEVAEEGVAPVAPEPETPEEIIISMKPFWVEQVDEQGQVRFLVCRFAAVTTSEELSRELDQKNTVLRDAIFYYLKNKDLTYLSDKENVETLKEDLLSVINQYLSVARLETLLIEQYMVK